MMYKEERDREEEKIAEIIRENKNKLLSSLTKEQREWYNNLFSAYLKEMEIHMDEAFEEGIIAGTTAVRRYLAEDDE